MSEERTAKLTIRMTPTEVAMLAALADKTGLSGSDIVRQNIRRDYAAAFGDKAPKSPKRATKRA